MERINRFCILPWLLVVFIGFLPAYAQVDYATATLRGVVLDPQGAVLGGANVTVTNPGTGLSKTIQTAADGAYHFQALPPGTYQIAIQAPGFSKEISKSVELSVGQSAVYDFHLKVGDSSIVIEVTGDSQLIQVDQTQQANTINQQQMEYLPNPGRGITAAVYTVPGVTNSDSTRSQTLGFTGFGTTGFSIGGSNGRNNLSTIDGGENEYGTGQYRTSVPLDAIQEYQVNRSSFNAEFGFTDGSAINIVTKQGGNQYHGSAFGLFRDHNTEATNFFNGLEGLPKAFDQSLYSGFTLGGPVLKDKVYFFASYEYQRLDAASFNFISTAPTVLGLNAPGQGANCAQLTDQTCYLKALKASGNPFLVGFANGITPGLVPLNNPALSKILNRDNGIFDLGNRNHNALLRFDSQPNPNNAISLRLGYQHNDGSTNNPDSSALHTRDFSILTNWTRTISPAVVNQVLVQIVPRNSANNVPNPFDGVNFSLGTLNVGGLGGTSSFGSPSLVPYLAHQQRYQFEDDVTWNKGSHTFKVGASYRPANYTVEDDLWFNNQFDFKDGVIPLISLAPAAVQAQLVGFNLTHGFAATGPTSTNLTAPQSFAFGIPADFLGGFNNPKWTGWGNYFGSYAQDTWKMNSRLTLNYGARFDFDGEPSPLGGSFYVSPRLGLSWDPLGDHKTVVRAGGGIYYAPIDVLIPSYGSLLDGSGRYINEVLSVLSPTNPQVPALWQRGVAEGELPFGRLTNADYAAVGINTTTPGASVAYGVAPNYKNPYTVQASLSVDRELAKNLSLELGYTMYHGVHLQMPLETGFTPVAGKTDITGGPFYAPNPGSTQLQHTTYESIGNSIYHGMTASLTKRYSSGLQFQVNYTWSKTIDDAIDFASFQNWFRPSQLNLFRAPSAFNIPQILVANAVYTTPFKAGQGNLLTKALANISIAPIVTVRSGLPFSILTPSLANGIPLDSNFAMPFHASRDNNIGANFATADLRLNKAIFVNRDRGIKVDLIAEGTNILNRVNFNRVSDQFDIGGIPQNGIVQTAQGPLNLLTGPYTGIHGVVPTNANQITQPGFYSSADTPRQLQFGLKVAF